jgi:hypothetical protein
MKPKHLSSYLLAATAFSAFAMTLATAAWTASKYQVLHTGAPFLAFFARGRSVNRHIESLRLLINDCDVMRITLRKPAV